MIGLVSSIRFGFAPLGIPNTGLGSSENKTQGGLPPGGIRFGFRPRGSPTVATGGGADHYQSGLPPNALRFGFKPRGTSGTAPTTATNSGIQRLKAFHEGHDAYYREVQRREALQVQQIRLAELQQQQREIEARRALEAAQRQEAQVRRPKAKDGLAGDGFEARIASLSGELAALNGAIIDTRAEIARLDAIEMQETLAASMREDDETILILAASI